MLIQDVCECIMADVFNGPVLYLTDALHVEGPYNMGLPSDLPVPAITALPLLICQYLIPVHDQMI